MLHARKDYNKRIQDSSKIIPENEPVFLLRAQDKYAPDVLQYYAFLVSCHCGHDQAIVANTLAHANKMRDWQSLKKCKDPDMKRKDSVY